MNIMLDFQQKRKVRSFMYNKITLVILFLLVVFLIHSTWRVWQKKQESEELRNISLSNVEELRQREADLQMKIDRLETEEGIEAEIRSKFSVAKQGEEMVLVVVEENNSTPTTTPKKSFWGHIKALFRTN